MLAGLAPAALDRFLATPLESFTPVTLVDAEALRERLRMILRDGYAWVRDEFSEGLASVAAPVVDGDGEVLAAVHVHGPSYRFPASGTREQVTERVTRAAGRISAELRSSRPR